MTLKDQMANDMAVGGVFLSTSDFAESFTFIPASGIKRTVKGIVDRTESHPELDTGLAQNESIEVMVSKDANGIPAPQLGDAIVLTGDSNKNAYAWSGETIDGDEHSLTLRFVRARSKQMGGSRQQR